MTRSLSAFTLASAALVGLSVFVRRAASKREDIDLGTAGVPGSCIDVDGQRLHYVEAGQGEPILLLHGWSGSTFSMRRTIPELANHYRVIALDLLGYGYSGRPADADYSTDRQAELLIHFMDRLQVDRTTVLGHSMGGGVAMLLALRHPERVERLVLVSSVTARETRWGRRFASLARPLLPLVGLTLVCESIVSRALRSVVSDPAFVTPEIVEGYWGPLRVKGHLRAQMKQMSDRHRDATYDPHQVRQPVLILWGEHDRVIPLSTGLELADQIPNAQLAVIQNAGHLALEEQPEECNRILLDFLARTFHASPGPVPTQSQCGPRDP